MMTGLSVDAGGGRLLDHVVDAAQQLGELADLDRVVVGVGVEAAELEVDADGEAGLEGGDRQLGLLHHALQVGELAGEVTRVSGSSTSARVSMLLRAV
jgi:hypothetical protein